MNSPESGPPSLTVDEIIQQFSCVPRGGMAREALIAAVARREEITPQLLARCMGVIARGEECTAEEYWLLNYGLMLLAEFREPLALPLLLCLLRLPEDDREMLIGDNLTDDIPRWLAAVQGGKLDPIKAFIEDPDADEMARWSALRSLVVLVVTGERTRDEIVAYLRELCGKLEREPSEAWVGVAECALDLHPGSLLDALRPVYKAGLIDEYAFSWEEIVAQAERSLEDVLAELPDRERPFTTAIDELARLDCLQPGYDWDAEGDLLDDPDWLREPAVPPYTYDLPAVPYVAPAKIGRNDPCPCGSGKKYKKCCLDRSEMSPALGNLKP